MYVYIYMYVIYTCIALKAVIALKIQIYAYWIEKTSQVSCRIIRQCHSVTSDWWVTSCSYRLLWGTPQVHMLWGAPQSKSEGQSCCQPAQCAWRSEGGKLNEPCSINDWTAFWMRELHAAIAGHLNLGGLGFKSKSHLKLLNPWFEELVTDFKYQNQGFLGLWQTAEAANQ